MFEIYNVAVVPLIIGTIQLLKRYGLPAKYSPFVAMFFGLAVSYLYITKDVKEAVIIGLMLGLSASGLYSSGKNLLENGNKKPPLDS